MRNPKEELADWLEKEVQRDQDEQNDWIREVNRNGYTAMALMFLWMVALVFCLYRISTQCPYQ